VSLYQNVPNPFNPTTAISFYLPRAARANLTIYDVRGRRVVTLVDGTVPAGFKRITWNGINTSGQQVSTGVYFYRLETGGRVLTRKMVMVK
jgi:flagellar hook assembly protein FlgD